jgi:hypothetical protein
MRSIAHTFVALVSLLVTAGIGSAQDGGDKPPQPPGGLPGLQAGQPPDPLKMMEQMREQTAKMLGLKLPPPAVKWGGMLLEPASDVLLDQLNLPTGQGMIVAKVEEDSAAAEAGLKKHDLVVKVNQHTVPADARQLLKALADVKTDAPVELIVVRKGKEQTLKAPKLPEAALATHAAPGFGGPLGPGVLQPPGGFGKAPPAGPGPGAGVAPGVLPGIPGGAAAGAGAANFLNGAKVSVTRNNEQFNADYQKDKLHVTLRGKIDGNQTKIEEISVDDGSEAKKYTKVEEVPQANRDTVNRLLQMATGNSGIFTPMPPNPPPGAGAGLPNPPPPNPPQQLPDKK